jgi:predicted GNAT family N-acyltransferase
MMNTDSINVEIVRFTDFESEIKHIRHQVFIVEQGIPESLEWDEHEHSSWHALARVGEIPAGTGRLQPDGKITRIAVLQAWRKRGIAADILQHLLQRAAAENMHRLYLNAQLSAVALYERFGFVAIGVTFDEGGIEHIRMERR